MRLPIDLMRELRVIATERGITFSALVREYLEEYLTSLELVGEDEPGRAPGRLPLFE